ncbi:DUF262 domain-containing protein [Mucilaginibacter lappiensis]|uniref:GmrSD restriction endonucleases N-terminal domain-containing protein n=1 Tax=Mucilaginibacter lappiensis TaxID=354630 RepID=A0A841JK55_9SPHI|nr:DUF262 domain-containing protein [Mucilaginibacter lappiensis]MBB6128341.1 hypothetical protein [Mucilaginibacter lappiensis]
MQLPEPQSKQYSSLLNEIESGQVKIPQFQREFVWDMVKSADLIDSIIKGYPIGTFIFWRTNERLRAVRDLGNFRLPEPRDGEFVNYVLDGQQRMTSLFASLKGLKITRESGRVDDYSEMYVDLDAPEDQQIVIVDILNKPLDSLIRITDLLTGSFTMLASYDVKYHKKLQHFQNIIQSYNFSIILLKDAAIDVATEVFTRINVGGKSLTLFEIMIAKTYDSASGFDLSERYRHLIRELTPHNYETISDTTVLQTISMILENDCTRKQILKLSKHQFINAWEPTVSAIKSAVEYFKFTYGIPVSKLLPYNALIVPYSYFFYFHKDIPTGDKQKYLQDFFWRCALSGRYSSGVEGKLAQDIKRIDLIISNKLPQYEWAVDISPEFIKNHGWFSAGRSFIKAILCLYAYKQPKSFNTNAIVNISNYWLKQANSRNYHHFFPKAYLNKNLKWENKDFWINHILNITIVDDFLNKREIAAKAPSKYMAGFKKKNTLLEETMKSHLINDLETFGIWDNNYEAFINKRAKAISFELKRRVIEADVDRNAEAILEEFYEDITDELIIE